MEPHISHPEFKIKTENKIINICCCCFQNVLLWTCNSLPIHSASPY